MLYLVLLSVSALSQVVAMPTADEPINNEVNSYNFPFITRKNWLARVPKPMSTLRTPVSYVVIHHSFIPAACFDKSTCVTAMRAMQNFHMDEHGWCDIGYNFAIGGDGAAYEGRGWQTLGAHSLHFNGVSLGICLIGDWTSEVPPSSQLKTAKALIAAGVQQGYIKDDYILVGHRQVRKDTECPGDALFQEIQSWDHYSSFPSSYKDLINISEVSKSVKNMTSS